MKGGAMAPQASTSCRLPHARRGRILSAMRDAPDSDFLALQEALVGRYSLEREIGRGGMGIVYLAHEVSLDRPVALKLLPPDLAAQPALRERFREAGSGTPVPP